MVASNTAAVAPSRILVVDDDPDVLNVLARVLRRAGHEVVTAESGDRALACMQQTVFDLAVCDRRMPGMDGIDLLARICGLQPMCSRVLLTGGLDLVTTVDAVNRGAIRHVVQKPIRPHELTQLVSEVLADRVLMVAAYRRRENTGNDEEHKHVEELFNEDHLRVALQPIIESATGIRFGQEALLRSSHAVLDGPAPVLAAVERQDQVGRLANCIVERCARWLRANPDGGHLFINVHPAELAAPDAMRDRLELLRPFADRVVLEITERSSLHAVARWEQSIDEIRSLGLRLAVDDLGAGYSSLSVLAELRPEFIKVDMSIVRDCNDDPSKRRLLELLCKFADASEAQLVAEGIETAAEAQTVKACGAGLLQGFYYARPAIPAEPNRPACQPGRALATSG